MGLWVPPGKHRLVLQFQPLYWWPAVTVSILAVSVLAVLVFCVLILPLGSTRTLHSHNLIPHKEKYQLERGKGEMSRKGKKKSPDSRDREEKSASDAAGRRNVPNEVFYSVGGEDAPTIRPFGPRDWFFAATLVVAVFLVYQPAWQGGFLWDDDNHLLNNPVLKPGGLAKVWVPGGYINYWPLTFTAYWLEFTIWGLNPLGFHLVNIAVHAVSALLVWRVLVRLRVPGAMFAAAIFALHPVNVESVAWISQLKGILSLMLALVSVLFFLPRRGRGAGGALPWRSAPFCCRRWPRAWS